MQYTPSTDVEAGHVLDGLEGFLQQTQQVETFAEHPEKRRGSQDPRRDVQGGAVTLGMKNNKIFPPTGCLCFVF